MHRATSGEEQETGGAILLSRSHLRRDREKDNHHRRRREARPLPTENEAPGVHRGRALRNVEGIV